MIKKYVTVEYKTTKNVEFFKKLKTQIHMNKTHI